MRKFLFSLVMFFALWGISTAHAAVGDIAGNVYSTDIRAFIDGTEIQSYCLDGKTAIAVEDLREYGFTVTYNDNNRALFVSRGHIPENAPQFCNKISSLPSGTIVSNYYETDIVTYMDGWRVPSYALDGFTIVAIEDLTHYTPHHMQSYQMFGSDYIEPVEYAMHRPFNALGFYHIWNDHDRTIKLISLRGGFIWINELGAFTAGDSYIYEVQTDGFAGDRIVKAAINNTGKTYTWYLLKYDVETYGLDLNPASTSLLYINTPSKFTQPIYDNENDTHRKIISPVFSKEIIINGENYYARDMFTVVHNYLYVREDLFEVLEKFI